MFAMTDNAYPHSTSLVAKRDDGRARVSSAMSWMTDCSSGEVASR